MTATTLVPGRPNEDGNPALCYIRPSEYAGMVSLVAKQHGEMIVSDIDAERAVRLARDLLDHAIKAGARQQW